MALKQQPHRLHQPLELGGQGGGRAGGGAAQQEAIQQVLPAPPAGTVAQ